MPDNEYTNELQDNVPEIPVDVSTSAAVPAEEPAVFDISMDRAVLREALDAVNTLNADRQQLKQYNETKRKLDKDLSTLTRNIEKEKNDTVRGKRQEIESGFDKQIRDVEREISDINSQRQKARADGVKNRIADSTAAPRQEIAGIKEQMNEYVKEQQAPSIMKSRAYYTLFSPINTADWIVDLVLAAIGVGAIILAYVKQASLPVFLIVLGAVVALAAAYMAIAGKTKDRYHEVMVACKNMFREIALREKNIKELTKNIQNDKDDSAYDLGGFDNELQVKSQQKEALGAQKAEALDQFDNVTKNTLTGEIDAKYSEDLSTLQTRIAENTDAVNTFTERVAAGESGLNQAFADKLGAKNLSREKIERMIGLIDSGEVRSLHDAVSRMK